MFDTLSFAEIDGQHAELLPGRTVLSLVSASGGGGGQSGGCSANQFGLVNVGLQGTQVIGNILNNVVSVLPILGSGNVSNSNC